MKTNLCLLPFIVWACSTVQERVQPGPNADLMRAAAEGNASGIEAALLAGADARTIDERSRTALHLAVHSGNLDAVKQLLLPKASVTEKKMRREGVAILPYANSTGSKNYAWISASLPDAIDGLMAENFDFKRKSAQEKAQAAIIISGNYVLEPGGKRAEIQTTVKTAYDNKVLLAYKISAPLDTNIFDALSEVAREIVEGLKKHASNEFAIRLKNSEVLLISDVNARDRGGLTPLFSAADRRESAIAALLIKAGADAQTDLIEAINFGNDPAAETIASLATEVNFRIAGGKTALMQASFKGRTSTVNALLARKANVDDQDIYGFGALMYAAQEGHSEIVKLLLSNKAKANVMSYDNLSILDAARRKGHQSIVEMLVAAGAK